MAFWEAPQYRVDIALSSERDKPLQLPRRLAFELLDRVDRHERVGKPETGEAARDLLLQGGPVEQSRRPDRDRGPPCSLADLVLDDLAALRQGRAEYVGMHGQ